MSKPEPDGMTEHDRRGVQRLMFAVEDKLTKADDADVALEQMVSRGATLVGAKDREQFVRAFCTLVRPLVTLELKRRRSEEP